MTRNVKLTLVVGALLLVAAAAQSPVAAGDKLILWTCDPSTGRQSWNYGNGTRSPYTISVRGGTIGWDIEGPFRKVGTGLHVWGIHTPPSPNQQWRFSATSGLIASASACRARLCSDLCPIS